MGFQYVEHKLLEKYIKESIATELKHHRIYDKDLKTALRTLYKTHPERATQCKYLLAVIGGLNRSDIENKTCILNAAAFYIWNQIDESYQGMVTSVFLSPTNSNLYNSLRTSLDLTKENKPDSKDLQDMYSALIQFMREHVYLDPNVPINGYLEERQQIFSKKRIRGYDVEKVLSDLIEKIKASELEQVKLAKEEQLAKEPDKKSATQTFGLFAEKSNTAMVDPSKEQEEPLMYRCSR
ncbi:hypothetical protein [Legionella cincinnatiensis]|uniref:Dot/Icm T4SS effector n=1 Tax=Legionella cincinnatiensis TaxID=28085 RepID=A0A378ILI1_9GAMM|nr:hypothetical protein [Legionella cincinnatiensis]KTC88299.1 Dot/Icm T4SS effector [Legionella cincinnatiensis]STX35853.1 Dot/Icm T4SS effector [Legionella cincinnatiensis]